MSKKTILIENEAVDIINERPDQKPLLDVALATYNHEKYLDRSLKSVLMQKTDFEFRILIGDDFSTDNTRSIIRSYISQYPDRITAVFTRRNLGILNDNTTNGLILLEMCTAKYTALLDGDDYWTDDAKLQKQVDFLEQHPDFVICCHNTQKFFVDDPSKFQYFRPDVSKQTKDVLTIEDQIRDVISYHTSSVVFRNGLFKYPDFMKKIESRDIAIFTILASYGKIKYLDDVMSVYLKHGEGATQFHIADYHFLQRIKMNNYLDRYFNGQYRDLYRVINGSFYERLFSLYKLHGSYYRLIKHSLFFLLKNNTAPLPLYRKLIIFTNNAGLSLFKVVFLAFINIKNMLFNRSTAC